MSSPQGMALEYTTKSGQVKTRWSPEELATLDQQLVDMLTAHHPQSVRHCYYRMTDTRLALFVPKDNDGYRRVQNRTVILRRNGRVPYDWIVDTGRSGYAVGGATGVADFLDTMRWAYKVNPWGEADVRVEVWVESRSLAGVLTGTCDELRVALYPCGGFSSITFAADSALATNASIGDKRLVVLYIGDYDPAGVLIDVALEREMRLHLNADIDFTFLRLGITPEQIEEFDLPGKPRKEGDNRSLHIKETVEAEAMRAEDMQRLVIEAVLEHLPAGAKERAAKATAEGRARLLQVAQAEARREAKAER